VSACQGKTDEAEPAAAPSQPSQAFASAAKPQDWSRFAGPGWEIEKVVEGKLTPGGEGDVVLLLHGTDPAKKVSNDGLGESELDLNPRKLVFLERHGGEYRKAGETSGLLPPANSEDSPCLTDPLEEGGISISGNVLEIGLQFWYSCGSWYVTNETYKFRKEDDRFRLIGFDRFELHRATQDTEKTSVNFLTGKREISTGNDVSEPPKPFVKKVSRIGGQKYWLDSLPQNGCQGESQDINWCFDLE
jgi:hypothetical protein